MHDQNYPTIKLGWYTVCLPAPSIQRSFAFYRALGFRKVGGEISQGWLVLNHGPLELSLMGFLKAPLLTFRGGKIPVLATELATRGLAPYHLAGMDPTDEAAQKLPGARAFDASGWPSSYTQDKSGRALPTDDSGDFLLDDPDGYRLYFDAVPVERLRFDAGEPFASEESRAELPLGATALGRPSICLRVQAMAESTMFYQRLGLNVDPTGEAGGEHRRLSGPAAAAFGLRLELRSRESERSMGIHFSGASLSAIDELAAEQAELRFERVNEGQLRTCDPAGHQLDFTL